MMGSRTVHRCAWPAELDETTGETGLARDVVCTGCGDARGFHLSLSDSPHIVGGEDCAVPDAYTQLQH